MFITRLLEKIYQLGQPIQLLFQEPEILKTWDDYLWSYSATSFLPHDLFSETPDCPIVLLTAKDALAAHPILLNLASQIPAAFPSTLERAIEVVSSDPEDLRISRERYRGYQALGFEIKTHKLETNTTK